MWDRNDWTVAHTTTLFYTRDIMTEWHRVITPADRGSTVDQFWRTSASGGLWKLCLTDWGDGSHTQRLQCTRSLRLPLPTPPPYSRGTMYTFMRALWPSSAAPDHTGYQSFDRIKDTNSSTLSIYEVWSPTERTTKTTDGSSTTETAGSSPSCKTLCTKHYAI